MAERKAAYATSASAPAKLGTGLGPGLRYVIDGRRNPELFLRHELLDDLVRAFASNAARREGYRKDLDPNLRLLGFDPKAFWTGLSEAGHSYLALRHNLDGRGRGRTGAEEAAVCAARIEMLTAAENRFGQDAFDQLLYTAVAPFLIHTTSTTFPDPAGRLRREAGGCK